MDEQYEMNTLFIIVLLHFIYNYIDDDDDKKVVSYFLLSQSNDFYMATAP